MNTFSDFIIAGSAKSGITALHPMLDQHPNAYVSVASLFNKAF